MGVTTDTAITAITTGITITTIIIVTGLGSPLSTVVPGTTATIETSSRNKRNRKLRITASPSDAGGATIFSKPKFHKVSVQVMGGLQFGLIAEEVAAVNPDPVVCDADGKVYTVRYDAVNAMLLNEFLKEHQTVQEQGATIARQQKQIEALTSGLEKVNARLAAASPSGGGPEASKPAPQVVLKDR